VGSDFTYEDISGRHLDEDEHSLIKEEAVNGKNAFVIKSTPKDKDEVEYSYRLIWSDKQTFLTLKVEYYNKRNELYKQMINDRIEVIEGTPTITRGTMKDIKRGHHTEIEFKKVHYNVGLKANIFKERYLRKPPIKWIK
jgi:outer membrane lipoprotein-sorting protein